MSDPWRLLIEDGVGAAPGLATDEVLSGAVPDSRPTLRLYTYRAHCVLVGRFQDIDREVEIAHCHEHGFEVNRRPTGGGAILMGPDQLGIALAIDGRGDGGRGRPRELMQRFSDGLVRGLRSLGIEAGFRGKNDLEVGGRKIAGLGIHRGASGGLLFHASLLVDLDVGLMARVLRTPFVAMTDQELQVVERRTTTARELTNPPVTMELVRARVAQGFADSFAVDVSPGELDASERAEIDRLVRTKYSTDDWIHQRTSVVDSARVAQRRTPDGTVAVHLELAGRTIKAAHLRGNFFADEAALADLEGRLRWHPTEEGAVRATVGGWAEADRDGALQSDLVAQLILEAAAGKGDPYGCFVSPGADVVVTRD